MTSFKSHRPQILLLFQETPQQVSFSELLGEEYVTFASNTPEGALTIFARQKEHIRILLTDLKMLRKSGLDVLLKAMQALHSLRVIVLTPDAVPAATTSGCIAYIPEASSSGALQEAITRALHEPKRPDCTVQDVLELFTLSQAKAALTVVNKQDSHEERGKIYVEHGKITNAFVADLQGIDAIRQLLTWTHAAFFTRYNVVAKQKPMNADWRDFLAAPSPATIPPRAELTDAYSAILRALHEQSDGLECACIFDEAGELLAAFPEQELARVTSFTTDMASIRRLGEHAGQLVGIDAIEEISVIHNTQLYMLYPISPIGMLSVLADPEYQGMLRWNCREALLRLKELLE